MHQIIRAYEPPPSATGTVTFEGELWVSPRMIQEDLPE